MLKQLIILLFFIFNTFSSSITAQQTKPLNTLQQENIKQYLSAVENSKKAGNNAETAKNLDKIASIYWDNNQLKEASDFYKQSLEYTKLTGIKTAIRVVNNSLAVIYSNLEQFENAQIYFQNCLQISRELNDKKEIFNDLVNLGITLQYVNKYKESAEKFEEALVKCKELNLINRLKQCYFYLSTAYQKTGNSTKAVEYLDLYSKFEKNDSKQTIEQLEENSRNQLQRANKDKQLTENQLQQEKERLKGVTDTLQMVNELTMEQQMQIELNNLTLKEKETQLKMKQQTIYFFIGIIILILTFAIIVYQQFTEKKRANKILALQNIALNRQKEEIAKKTRQIIDSINYANRIQTAILPSEKNITKYLPNSFIFFKPRDIVSGDFYWFSKQGDKLFLAVVDCTGHGVPGAFMSMIGNTLLNQIVNEKQVYNPAEILEKLNAGVLYALNQQSNDEMQNQDDGMDITLSCIDLREKTINIAAANHCIYIVHNEKIELVEGDLYSIGGIFSSNVNISFKNYSQKLETDDVIYMFTDGYKDQFGSKENKKFMANRFERLLFEVYKLPFSEQKHQLAKKFEEWKGDYPQIDDILVVGFKI